MAQEQVINELVVKADCFDVGDKVDADSIKLHKRCISNDWMDGAVIMREVSYLGVKAVSDGGKKRKQRMNESIITKV